ncbi:hypothetical protein, partial [Proteus vulgaris]|uniref:hypothetical protein n=1 Tax=Proteus vulgaris TaxID=585 RepID=UPI00235EF137
VYPFDYRIYEPFGIMGVSGAATCVQKNYKYEAFGSIGFGGTVEKITLPVWTYNGRGALSAALDAEPVRIVHPFW